MKGKSDKTDSVPVRGSSISSYIKNLVAANSGVSSGKGLGHGVTSMLAKSALKRLPPPFNYVAPLVVEKLILTYGVDNGRDVLLKGLHWIKKVTDEKPSIPDTTSVSTKI